MKNLLTTFVLCSIAASTAMADEKRKSEPAELDHSSRTIDCNNPTPFAAGIYAIGAGEAYYFSYTGNGAGIHFDTCAPGTTGDTDVRIYDDCNDFTANFYRDGLGSCNYATYMNCVDFTFNDGQNYLIVITDYYGDPGTFEIVMLDPCTPPPNPCNNFTYQTTGACGEFSGDIAPAEKDWFLMTATGCDGSISTCNQASFDTYIEVYTQGTLFPCNPGFDGTLVTSNDDNSGFGCLGFTSYLAYTGATLPAGNYWVKLRGWSSSNAGTYTLTFDNLCCGSADTQDQPVAFELGKAFPNPFNPSTTINFTMGQTAQANLTVYNMNGQAVANLIEGVVSAGAQSVVFDANALTSGVYFYTLSVGGRSMTEKMILVR